MQYHLMNVIPVIHVVSPVHAREALCHAQCCDYASGFIHALLFTTAAVCGSLVQS